MLDKLIDFICTFEYVPLADHFFLVQRKRKIFKPRMVHLGNIQILCIVCSFSYFSAPNLIPICEKLLYC